MQAVKLGAGLVLGVSLLAVHQVRAQTPQRISAIFDDWAVSCAPAAQGQKACEMLHTQTVEGQPTPVGQVTIQRASKKGPFEVVLLVPPNVWVPAGVKFVIDGKEPSVAIPLRWCTGTRCLAEARLTDDVMKKLRARREPGSVEYKEASQRDISVPVSFKGFAPALSWMEKQ